MATSDTKSQAPAKQDKTPVGQLTAEALASAYANMVSEHQASQSEYQKQCAEAYSVMVNQQQQAVAAAHKPVEAAKQKVVEAAAAAQVNPEKAQDFHNAYQEFMNAVSKAQSSAEVQDAFQKAQNAFQKAYQKSYDTARQRCDKAYQEYVKALKKAWTEIDPGTVDPATMRVIEWSTKVAAQAKG